MKKIFGSLIVLCMMLSMTTLTTFAASAEYTLEADKTTVAPGETITFTIKVSEEASNMYISAATANINYPEDKLSITESDIEFPDLKYAGTTNKITAAKGSASAYLTIANNWNRTNNTTSDFVNGAKVIATVKAKVLDDATGDIELTDKGRSTISFVTVNFETGALGKAEKINLAFPGKITIKKGDDPTPSKPVITLDPSNPVTGENSGIVDINTNAETGAYSVKVKAPIGKKAVIYIDGVAQTGSEIAGTATKATTIKVAYEDVADEVITYVVPMSSIYGAEETGIAAFGKGTIAEGVAYGIKFGGLTGTYKDITDYKFPAKGNVGGIFGVEVKDAPAGDYTAQAYVGDTMGAAISFTK